jgi:hypothetical protein
MGTSVQMIDRTYGHLAQDAEDQDRELLDAYAKAPATAVGTLGVLRSRMAGRCERERCSFAGVEPAGFEPATSCLQNPAGVVQQER